MSRKIICSRCGKIVDVGHDCTHAYKDTRKKTQLQGSRWQRIRQTVRVRDGCCVLCFMNGEYSPIDEVHHVKPREVDNSDDNIYNEDNCISLCQYHHHMVHNDGWQKYYDTFKDYIEERKRER